MAFSWIQGNKNTVNPGKSVAVVLTTNPIQGNLVCVGIGFNLTSGPTGTVTIQDSNGNVYTATPQSPSPTQTNNTTYLFYLIAPANASKTITASWPTTSVPSAIHADEFHSDVGGISFDTDAEGTGSVAGGTINTPSITPDGAGELLYASAASDNSQTAPTAGGTLGIWTGSGGGVSAFGDITEYDLSSAAGASAVQWTQSPNGTWSAMAAAFAEGTADIISMQNQWQLVVG